jgi:hypothetical protein
MHTRTMTRRPAHLPSWQSKDIIMWLLGIYTILFVVFEIVAVGLLFVFDKVVPDVASIVFMVALLAGFVIPWPIAVRVTEGWDK